jgi:SAM-dependent methyltransferase
MKNPKDPADNLIAPQREAWFFIRFRRLLERVRALLSLPELLDVRLSQIQDEFDRRMDKARSELKAELSAQLSFSFHDFETSLSEQKEQLAVMQREQAKMVLDDVRSQLNNLRGRQVEAILGDIGSQLEGDQKAQETALNELRGQVESVRNTQFETTNRLIHLDTSLHTRLNTLENERLPSITEDIHQLTAAQFLSRASMNENRAVPMPEAGERYQRSQAQPFDAVLERAKLDFPRVFPLWVERLDTMEKAFRETRVGNAAHVGDSASRVFRGFVELNARGRLLDVGCGIFGVPYYLASYPAKLISGIDPLLPPVAAAELEFVRGISEYLPWPDESFSTVISATSLDHCLSLERSLVEIRRVLRPGGRFLLWIGSNPGAPQYQPDSENFAPADRFHLFHFDVAWFEPMLEDAFDLTDRVELRKSDYTHVIFNLVKK